MVRMKMMRRDGTSLKSMGTSGRSSSQYLHKKHTIIQQYNTQGFRNTENMNTTKKHKHIIYSTNLDA